MTYAEIYARRKALGLDHLSIEEFSRLYGDNPEFKAGRSGGAVGQALKATSAAIDRGFATFGLQEAGYQAFKHLPTVATLGYADPNEQWGEAGRGVARGLATMATMPFGGLGVAAGAAAGGVDIYEKTDSPLAGVAGAGLFALTPLAGRVGGGLATGVGTKLAPSVFGNELLQGAAQGVYKSAATRALQFTGQQAGYLGQGLLTQGTTGAIAAPTGQRWDAFKSAFDPANIATTAVTNLPFMVNDVMVMRAQKQMVNDQATAERYATFASERAKAQDVAYRDANNTVTRYDSPVFGSNRPYAPATSFAADGTTMTSTKAATWRSKPFGVEAKPVDAEFVDVPSDGPVIVPPAPGAATGENTTQSAITLAQNEGRLSVALLQRRNKLGYERAQNVFNELKQQGVIAEDGTFLRAKSTTQLPSVAEAFQRAQREQAYEIGLLRSVSREAPPTVKAKLVDVAKTTPLEQRVTSDDVQVRTHATLEAAGQTADVVVEKIASKVNAGEDVAVATKEAMAATQHVAEKKLTKRQRESAERQARVAQEALPRSEAATAEFDRVMASFADKPEVASALNYALRRATASNQPNPNKIIEGAVLKWSQEAPDKNDADSLVQMLRGAANINARRAVDHSQATVFTKFTADDVPVFEKGSPRKFTTQTEAQDVAAQLRAYDVENRFSYSANFEKKGGYWKVVATPWADTALGGGVTDLVLDTDVAAGHVAFSESPQFIIREKAKRVEEKATADVVQELSGDDVARNTFLRKLSTMSYRVVRNKQTGEIESVTLVEGRGKDQPSVIEALSKETIEADGTSSFSAERLNLLLEAQAAPASEKGPLKERLVELFDGDTNAVNDWLKTKLVKATRAAWDVARGAVKADGDVKKMLSLTPSDAVLPAGGGFYFNVGRYENGRLGKHMTPKSGVVSEAQFLKIGRGTDQPLRKDELELYRVLVPDAFGDTKNVLWTATSKRESEAIWLSPDKGVAQQYQDVGGARELKAYKLRSNAKGYNFEGDSHELVVKLGLISREALEKLDPGKDYDFIDVALPKYMREKGYDYYTTKNGSSFGDEPETVVVNRDKLEAAVPEGHVNVPKLVAGLRDDVVDVQVYGQDGKADPVREEFDAMTHLWYDNLSLTERSALDTNDISYVREKLPERQWKNAENYLKLKEQVRYAEPTGPRATSYYNSISPFDTKKYPVVRIDVVVPQGPKYKKQLTFEEWKKTGSRGPGFEALDRELYDKTVKVQSEAKAAPLWSPDNLHENLPNTLGWAMVQVVPDPVTGKKMVFVGEQQSRWGQTRQKWVKDRLDDAQVYLGKSVKAVWPESSLVWKQIKKQHPEKDFNTAIVDKDMLRTYAEFGDNPPSHPALDAQHELVLKAVVKWAREQGIERVALSDAETAMMTEMHDTQKFPRPGQEFVMSGPWKSQFTYETGTDPDTIKGLVVTEIGKAPDGLPEYRIVVPKEYKPEPSQSGGMRLHYDTTLTSTMSRIAGNKGVKVDLGVHKNINDVPSITGPLDATGAPEFISLGHEATKGSPVFRNPDGTPKTNVTGTMYDISNVPIAERGAGPAFGSTLKPEYIGQRRTLAELLPTVGLDGTWTDDVSRLITLYDNPDVAYAQLLGSTDAAGLFTVQRDGQKLVWLSQQNNPRRSLFALTHELNGHALWQAKREGRLDAETTHRMTEWENLVAESHPETRKVMLKELWRHLPAEFRKDTALKKLVDSTAVDGEEFLANVNAIASLNLVHSSKSVWKDLLTYLPKPLADLLVTMARTTRRVFESINGVLFSREHGWNEGAVNEKARKDLGEYIDTLYGVLKVDRERSAQAAKALRLGLLTDAEARFTAGQNPDYWVAANRDEEAVIQAMGLARDDNDAKGRSLLPEGSIGFTKMFGPMGAFAIKYPKMRRLLNTATRAAATAALMEGKVLEALGLKRDGFKLKMDKSESNPLFRVESDIALATLRDKIIARANVTNTPVAELFAKNDVEVAKLVRGLAPSKLADLRGAFVQHEATNAKQNEWIKKLDYDRLTKITATAMLHKNPDMSLETAETLATEIIKAQRQGQKFAGTEKTALEVLPFVEAASARIEEASAYFASRPYFVSYRRFGEFSVTVKFSDGRKEVSPSFETQLARDNWLREQGYDRDPRATIKYHKSKFRTKGDLGNEAMEILHEVEMKNIEGLTAALVSNGMDADTAKTLVNQWSTYGEVSRELAAQKLGSKSPQRRFIAGYEDLNATEQQIQYLQMVAHGKAKALAKAEHAMLMAEPEARKMPAVDRETIAKAFEQWQNPDGAVTKAVRNAGYFMYMLLHPVNMAQDYIQPFVGALPSWMVNDGLGIVEAHKLIGQAWKDRHRKSKLSVDEQRMLKQFKDSNSGLASYSDDANNEALQLHNLHAIAKGRKTATLGSWMSQKMSSALLHVKQIHRHATDFGMESAMLATYRWQRSKGLSHEAAYNEAFNFVMPAMGAQGKGGRAQGIWDAGMLKPVTASITSLQSFNMNMLFTAKGTFERAIGRVPGLTKQQRIDSTKAFAGTMALMAVTGGIMGIVGAAPAMTIIDKVFGVNSREALADMLRGDDDDEYDDVVQQVAMHGALSWLGGPDIGSKFASQGFLGFNGYDGWNPESALGVGYDLVKRVFTLPEKLGSEGVGALTALAPQPFKRGLDAWKNDWEFRRKDGSLIDESTPWEQSLYAVLGVKPTRIANLQERDTWQRLDAQNDSEARATFVNEMMELMDEGDFASVREETIRRAATREGERPDMIANTLAAQYAERLYGRSAGRRAGYNSRLGRTTPGDDMTEMQRLQIEDAIRRQLNMGFATSPEQLRKAQEVDAIRALNPTMSVKSAREWVEQRSGRGGDVMRGATYRQR